jgi:hypothetical protein
MFDLSSTATSPDTPLDQFMEMLAVVRKLQSDFRQMGQDRVDLYFEAVEGDWLENWQGQESDLSVSEEEA